MILSVITKNLNWEFLTINLVTFKRWDGIKDEKFWCYGDSLKNLIFTGGSRKTNIWGESPKKQCLDSLQI